MKIIIEYCKYGNIQDYLRKNRSNFIDQINENTDKINSTITSNNDR